ncbi:WD40-repeat-containing domain protein, partial [Baffinella frigidus]
SRIWDLGFGVCGCPVVAHTRELRAVDFSPCGARFATGEDSAVIVWDAQSGNAEHHFLRGFGAWALSFSADGARLASVNSDQSIRVWDATTWALLRTIQASFVASVRLSPTGSRILSSAGGNSLIQFWDVDSGAKIRSIEGREFAVFSPDGRSIATAGAGRNFRDVLLLDAESGALRLRMVGHADNVRSATFSVDDGSKLASGSRDGTCKVWDSSTGALLLTINIGSRVSSVAFGR